MSIPRNERNNNIGNIDFRNDRNRPGQLGSDGRFIRFATPEQGVQAAVEVLHVYRDRYGINTLQGIVNRWAPPSENNTGNYINHMERHVGVSANQPLDLNDPTLVAKIIAAKGLIEGGPAPMQRTFTPQVIARGVQLAFEQPSSITGQRHTPTGGSATPQTPVAGTQIAGGTTPQGGATQQGGAQRGGASGSTGGGGSSGGGAGGGSSAQTRPSGMPQGMAPGEGKSPDDMVATIVMALLAMLFGAGMSQTAQAPQQEVGNMTPPATPPRPQAAPTPAPAVARG